MSATLPPATPDPRTAAAYHAAGQSFISFALGLLFADVTMVETTTGYAGIIRYPRSLPRDWIENEGLLSAALAGVIAERSATGNVDNIRELTAISVAEGCAARMGGDAAANLRDQQRGAVNAVRHGWPSIDLVAQELIKFGKLDRFYFVRSFADPDRYSDLSQDYEPLGGFLNLTETLNLTDTPDLPRPSYRPTKTLVSSEAVTNEQIGPLSVVADILLKGIAVLLIGWVLINWALSAISFGLAMGFVVLVVIMVTAVYNAIRKR